MNIGDYIKGKLGIWSVELPDSFITAELSKIGLSNDEEITADTDLDLFFYNIIPDIMLQPSSVSEGGYSITYNKQALTYFYKHLCSKLGKADLLQETNSQIKDITAQWR